MAVFGRCLAAGILISGLVGCAGKESHPPPIAKVAGCEAWSKDGACIVGKGKLRIWLEGHDSYELKFDVDGPIPPTLTAEGHFFEVDVPLSAKKLRIHDALRRPFELRLKKSTRPDWTREATDLIESSELTAAENLVSRQAESEAAWKVFYLARLAYRRNDRDAAVDLAKKGAALWIAAEQPGYAINELILASQALSEDAHYQQSRQHLDAAARILDSTAEWTAEPVRLHFIVEQQRATLAYLTGDVRTALASLDRLDFLRQECRLLTPLESSDLVQLEAAVLADLGRFAEAAELLDSIRSLRLEGAEAAMLDSNRGWIALLARQAGQGGAHPRPFFEAAQEYYSQSGLDHQKFNILINLAATDLLDGRLDEAAGRLRLAEPLAKKANAIEKFMFDDLEARLLLLRGNPRAALEKFRILDIEAHRHQVPAAKWQAQTGKAEALVALGQGPAAIEAFERASKLEDRELLFIPIDGGRETFLAQREKATRQHLELLLARGLRQEALELVRRRRSQSLAMLRHDERLASLDPTQRERWDRAAEAYRKQQEALESGAGELASLPPHVSREAQSRLESKSTELAAMLDASLAELGLRASSVIERRSRPGELVLAFFPLEASWLVFAQNDEGHITLKEKDVPPGSNLDDVAADLLASVAPLIHASEKLRILPWGDLDFHALSFEGRPLLATKPVVYGVDVGGDGSIEDLSEAPRAVLVGDPGNDLNGASREIGLAHRILANHGGIEVKEPLIGADRAWALAVRQAVAWASYFHFAGHGRFSPAGSQSRLSLRGGDLTAGDVFTFKTVPAQVLLSSCSVGRSARASGIEGLSLAYAFVLAGSRQVVAATREVNDDDTAALIKALYENLFNASGRIDLTRALQQAQIKLSRENPASDSWKAFRAFEP